MLCENSIIICSLFFFCKASTDQIDFFLSLYITKKYKYNKQKNQIKIFRMNIIISQTTSLNLKILFYNFVILYINFTTRFTTLQLIWKKFSHILNMSCANTWHTPESLNLISTPSPPAIARISLHRYYILIALKVHP